MKFILIILVATLVGCAGEWNSPGIPANQVDNPNVIVTSDIDVIEKTPMGFESPISIRLDPDLRSSYERALEQYFTEGEFRIISCEITTYTNFNKQHVSFSMLVEANGSLQQTKHEWSTSSAGWGGKAYEMIPSFLDSSAKLLYEKLSTPTKLKKSTI